MLSIKICILIFNISSFNLMVQVGKLSAETPEWFRIRTLLGTLGVREAQGADNQ